MIFTVNCTNSKPRIIPDATVKSRKDILNVQVGISTSLKDYYLSSRTELARARTEAVEVLKERWAHKSLPEWTRLTPRTEGGGKPRSLPELTRIDS